MSKLYVHFLKFWILPQHLKRFDFSRKLCLACIITSDNFFSSNLEFFFRNLLVKSVSPVLKSMRDPPDNIEDYKREFGTLGPHLHTGKFTQKIYNYKCINQTNTWIHWWWPFFRLLANCFLLFCSDLAVLIFPTPFADIQRHHWKLAEGPRGGDIQLFNPFPLYCFTLMYTFTL